MVDSQGKKIGVDDFVFGKQLGEGSYSRVILAKKKDTNVVYAVKIVNKGFIQKEGKSASVMSERNAYLRFHHPLVNRLYYSFQDKENLYFVTQYCEGGDLANMINYKTRGVPCPDSVAQFFAAEILLALNYIHTTHNAVHRDVKPENILLQASGHISLTDFGTILFLDEPDVLGPDGKKRERGYTFCGSSCYLSPEVLDGKRASIKSDLWALGCILYQLLTGSVLFQEENDYLIFQLISQFEPSQLVFPPSVSKQAQDLIFRLLVKNPDERIGYDELFTHPYFQGIDFDNLANSTPPFIPPVQPPWSFEEVDQDPSFEDILREEQAELVTDSIDVVMDSTTLLPKPMRGVSVVNDEDRKNLTRFLRKADTDLTKTHPEDDSVFLQSQIPLDQLLPKNGNDWKTAAKQVDPDHRQQAFTTASGFIQEPTSEERPKDSNRFNQYLDTTEEVLYSSLILRGRCLSIFKRLLVLTTRPRIFCINVRNGKLEFNLALRELGNVKYHTDRCFSFEDIVAKKKYYFRSIQGDVKMWVETINSMCSFVNGEN